MSRCSLVLMGAIVGLGVVASAGAATITYTDTTFSQSTDWTHSFALNKFDPSLGTLENVRVSLVRAITTSITVTALTDNTSGAAFTRFDVDQATIPAWAGVPGDLMFVTADQYYGPLALNEQVSLPTVTKTVTTNVSYSNGDLTDLASYEGTGTFTLTFATNVDAFFSASGGNVAVTQLSTADVTPSVTYTYTPVPEPGVAASVACVAMSMLGLRQRSKKA